MSGIGPIVDRVEEVVGHRPHPLLRTLVVSAHGYRIVGAAPGIHVGMPSSTLTVVIPLDEPLMLGRRETVPRPFDTVVAGLHTAATHIHHDGHQFGIQLQLAPAAARPLLGIPPGELVGISVTIEDLLPTAGATIDRMRATPTWAERFAILDAELLDRVGAATSAVDGDLQQAWRLCRTSTSIGQVAATLGWSTRYLQRRFRGEYGLSPAEPARLDRFHRSVRLVGDPTLHLADVAARAGYSDQPHMTRSWTRFAGVSPARWRATETLTARGPTTDI